MENGAIRYLDRITGRVEKEEIYGEDTLRWLLREGRFFELLRSCAFGSTLPSRLYGLWQKMPWTRRRIRPFVERFDLDPSEFLKPLEAFSSFDDFFTRRLKEGARPIDPERNGACIPADGRYLVYSDLLQLGKFPVKGELFDLKRLLRDRQLAQKYASGSLVIGRLCPIDYHRFHFPCACLPSESRPIQGPLWPVNPLALRKRPSILVENKRVFTLLETELFGEILYIEVGAVCVGSIHQTYLPQKAQAKGAEKGYFSFGGSTLLLLFKKNRIRFERDLLEASKRGLEMRCLLGQPMGVSTGFP